MNGASGTQNDMYSKYFPGEKWTIIFEPTDEQAAAVTAHARAHATDDVELEQFMQALGLLPYESAFNPEARDAWTKKPVQVDTTVMCRRGHLRAEHSYTYPNGKRECRACRKHVNAEHLAARRAAREAAKEAAA